MSMSFNAVFYLDKYPDVLLGIAQKKVASAEAHWNEFGAAEGRNPNANFDTKFYFQSNLDVLTNGVNPLDHFLKHGASEGRSPSATFVTNAKFDTVAYAAANTDLAAAGITTPAALYEHFAKFGFSETRPGVQTTDGVAITDGVAGGTVGATFTLTTNVDQGAPFTGTSANDTFVGVVSTATPASNTVGAADVLDGGNGLDTLAITVADHLNGKGRDLAAVTTSNIETISVRNVANDFIRLNGANFVGATEFVNDHSTGVVTFNSISKADVTVKGNGSVTNGATTIDVGATAVTDTFTLNIKDGVKAGAINVNDAEADWTTATVNSTGAANTVGAVNLSGTAAAGTHTIKTLTVNAATNLTTGQLTGFAVDSSVVISGAAAKVVLGLGNVAANVDSIDASGLTAGGVTVTLDGEADTKFVGGQGADKVTTGGVLTTGSVNAGNGTDTLTIAANAHLTATTGKLYTNFETLGVADGVTVDMDNIAGITSVTVNDASNAQTIVNDMSAVQAGAVTLTDLESLITLQVKGAATPGQIDTLKLTVDDGDTTLSEDITTTAGVITSANVEKLEVVAVDDAEIADVSAMAALTKVTLSGAGDHNFTTDDLAVNANTAINASTATGTVTINASAATGNGVAITGSATGVNVLTGSGQGDILVGGAAADTLNGGGTAAVAEVQTFTVTGAVGGGGAGNITVGGAAIAVAANDTIDQVGAKIAGAVAAIQAILTSVETVTYDAATNTVSVTYQNGRDVLGNIVTNDGTATGPTFGATLESEKGVSAAGMTVDTYTGGAGADTFIVGTANATAAASADEIKDFVTKSDKIDFQGADAVVGSATNYSEGTAAVGTFALALAAANTALNATVIYNAQQVGADTYVFFDANKDGDAADANDMVVKLTGVSLAGIEFGDLVA